MDKDKKKDNHRNSRKTIPFIRIDSSATLDDNNSCISISSSEESLLADAPIVRQPSCSVDIDMIPSLDPEKINSHRHRRLSNAYLDTSDERDSVKDIT